MIIIKHMLDYLVYLNDHCPPSNQFVLSNCVNIINSIYEELRIKYRIPKSINKYKDFKDFLYFNDVEELYVKDLPYVSSAILSTPDTEKCPEFLQSRVKKLQEFFDINQTGYIPFNNKIETSCDELFF